MKHNKNLKDGMEAKLALRLDSWLSKISSMSCGSQIYRKKREFQLTNSAHNQV